MNKKAWKRLKKVIRPAFGCVQYPKAGRNTQQTTLGADIERPKKLRRTTLLSESLKVWKNPIL